MFHLEEIIKGQKTAGAILVNGSIAGKIYQLLVLQSSSHPYPALPEVWLLIVSSESERNTILPGNKCLSLQGQDQFLLLRSKEEPK
jgi:hypothetical protein